MKKNKLILTTFALGICASLVAPTIIEADEVAKTTTKGKVGFTGASKVDNDLTIPETKPVVTIVPPSDGGFAEKEGIAILAPVFDFGTKEIAQEEQIFDVKPMAYTDKEDTSKTYYLPPMLVVKDLRGKGDKGAWSVYAQTTDFTTSSGQTLAGAQMSINTGLLFNNNKTTAGNPLPDAGDQNVTSDTTNFGIVTPFVFNNQNQRIMFSQNGKGSGQTTLVPDTAANYAQIKAGKGTHYAATDTISAVQLKVPAATIRTVDTYTADITWTLYDTPDGK